jgi:ABC-2 type transport system permease protein
MWMICKKEWQQFFSSLTGYIFIIVFLLANGLMLFVFEDNIFSFGYATLDKYFQLAPWILLLLIPAITMKSFADEFKSGTYEILQTLPLTKHQIIIGKYLGSLFVAFTAILPTLIYIFSIQKLSVGDGLDIGATTGAFIGLFILAAVFSAIGICSSSFTNNAVIAFIISLIACVVFYFGFNAIGKLSIFSNYWGYYISLLGIDFHYNSISKGIIDSRDIIYFSSIISLLLFATSKNLLKR